ncbi:MAG: hypothetical protein H0T11_03000 [Chthoniobacterales bacterium]|nr:hypothetical protein [Chthoniobacterales bacterium]
MRIDREPWTLTPDQKKALELLGRQVIANMELRNNLRELETALAAREAAEGPSGEAAIGLDEIIETLDAAAADLRAIRQGKRARS